MMFRGDRQPMPAQFALRVAVLSGLALVLFSVIFFRLWYLQVLSSDKYVKEAENNQVREITVAAPRGEILDREGHTLVGNRTALALQVRPLELPKKDGRLNEELNRLAQVSGMSVDHIKEEIRHQSKDFPASPVTLSRDVPYQLVYYLRENQVEFPGVTVERVYVRGYPHGTLAAHILGYVREVSQQQLNEPTYEGLEPGDEVGQAGVEDTYDSVLRGVNGVTKVQVDATGQPTGHRLSYQPPKAGNDLRLTIDQGVQQAGETALASFGGLPGAFVAMNVHNGQILGLGSYPSYDPSIFAKPFLSQSEIQQVFGDPSDPATSGQAPIFDRAIQGGYPTGSTFKPITAIAALESGNLSPTETLYDSGSFTEGGITLHNAGGAAYGALQLPQALQVSSDVYFYQVGARLNESDTASGPLQHWAQDLAIGSPTGIDMTGEASSFYLLPTPEWRNELYKKGGTDRPWSLGDNVNLAVGQGDLKTNPLQMAVAYAALANGGDVVRPHVGLDVQNPDGRVVQQIEPAPIRHLNVDPHYQQVILGGLHAAAQEGGGTSCPVFCNYPIPMAGKTGTAQHLGQADQSWYVGMAPYPNPDVVVAATIEQGGFGVEAAAPTVEQILSAYFDVNAKKRAAIGSSPTTPTTPTPPTTGGVNLYG